MNIRLNSSNNFFLFSFSLLLTLTEVSAEYRAYQYFVVPQVKNYFTDNTGFLTISSLDPTSFLAYSGGNESIKITLLRTWMCPGHTGGAQEVCASPYKQYVQQELKEKNESR